MSCSPGRRLSHVLGEHVSEGRVAPPVGGRVVRLGLVHEELHNLREGGGGGGEETVSTASGEGEA